jgi:hypothetical protein
MIDQDPRGIKTFVSGSTTLVLSSVFFRSTRYEDYRGPPPSSSSRDSRGPPPPRYRSRSPIGRGPSPPRSGFLSPPAPIVFFLLSIFSDTKKNLCLSEIESYSRFQMLSNIRKSENSYIERGLLFFDFRIRNTTKVHNIPGDIPAELVYVYRS